MRKAIAIIGLAGCMYNTSIAQTTNDQFTLSGKFSGTATPYIYLRYNNVLDSTVIKDGRFFFKGTVNGPTNAYLYRNPVTWRSEDPNLYSFFLEPGALTAEVKENEVNNSRLKGSATQADMDELKKQKAPIQKEWEPFFKMLDSVNKIDNFKFQEAKSGLKPYYAAMEKIDFAYIDKHPASFLSAHLLRGYLHSVSTEKLNAYYNQFPEKVKATAGKTINEELERRKLGVEGTIAADFSAPDINGQPLKLSDFKGKYVLIDFWASWCLPCRKGNPHLKKLYAAYKDKGLEIIGVSDDDRKPDAWKKAVEQDGISMWKHVLRGLDMEKLRAGIYNERDISKKYGIYSLPTKILIDPQGKVIARYEGDDKDEAEMDKKFKAVFGQ